MRRVVGTELGRHKCARIGVEKSASHQLSHSEICASDPLQPQPLLAPDISWPKITLSLNRMSERRWAWLDVVDSVHLILGERFA